MILEYHVNFKNTTNLNIVLKRIKPVRKLVGTIRNYFPWLIFSTATRQREYRHPTTGLTHASNILISDISSHFLRDTPLPALAHVMKLSLERLPSLLKRYLEARLSPLNINPEYPKQQLSIYKVIIIINIMIIWETLTYNKRKWSDGGFSLLHSLRGRMH